MFSSQSASARGKILSGDHSAARCEAAGRARTERGGAADQRPQQRKRLQTLARHTWGSFLRFLRIIWCKNIGAPGKGRAVWDEICTRKCARAAQMIHFITSSLQAREKLARAQPWRQPNTHRAQLFNQSLATRDSLPSESPSARARSVAQTQTASTEASARESELRWGATPPHNPKRVRPT